MAATCLLSFPEELTGFEGATETLWISGIPIGKSHRVSSLVSEEATQYHLAKKNVPKKHV